MNLGNSNCSQSIVNQYDAYLTSLTAVEYLEHVCAVELDQKYVGAVRKNMDTGITMPEGTNPLFKFTQQTWEEAGDNFDPLKGMQGPLIQGLREEALTALDSPCQDVLDAPVGVAPTGVVNACCAPVPSGGSIVLINHASIGLSYVSHALLAFKMGRLDVTLKLIVGFVGFRLGLNLNVLEPLNGLQFDHAEEYQTIVISEAFLMFLLLHEYGHISLGHLRGGVTTNLFSIDGDQMMAGAQRYTQRHEQEFAADNFAVEGLMKSKYRRSEWLNAIGLLMRLEALALDAVRKLGVEFGSDDHPCPIERWNAIKRKVDPTAHSPESLTTFTDEVFDTIAPHLSCEGI